LLAQENTTMTAAMSSIDSSDEQQGPLPMFALPGECL
jgi:hypothetical protein